MAQYTYKGYSLEDLQKMTLEEFAKIAPARIRRTLLRRLKIGFPPEWYKFFKKIYLQKQGKYKKPIKTHAREIPILPFMVGCKIQVYNGKEWVELEIRPEMIGYRIGQFVITKKFAQHNIGNSKATKKI